MLKCKQHIHTTSRKDRNITLFISASRELRMINKRYQDKKNGLKLIEY